MNALPNEQLEATALHTARHTVRPEHSHTVHFHSFPLLFITMEDVVMEPADDTADRETAAVQRMIDNRVSERTKIVYHGKINQIKSFITDRYHIADPVPPFQHEHLMRFFGSLIDSNTTKPLAPATVTNYSSALRWYYREFNMDLPSDLELSISSVLRGYKKDYAQQKLEGIVEVFEGKQQLPFAGYRHIAEKLFAMRPTNEHSSSSDRRIKQHTWNEIIFAHSFLVLQWNLIARSSTVADTMYEHMSWHNDCLIVSTPKHKGDQEGAKCFPKHVYANPTAPAICPILTLAILTFTRSFRANSTAAQRKNFLLFTGSNQKQRFCAILQSLVQQMPATEAAVLGSRKDKIGSHSLRKGAASFASSMVGGPSTAQIFLRAGWSLGNVQDRYLFGGEGQDELCGRTVAGLPITERSFASLPPHLDKPSLDAITEQDWRAMLPCYPKLPDVFKPAIPFLFASILYHMPFLRTTLPTNHPLFSCPLVSSGYISQYSDRVLSGIGVCSATGIIASGIPPHLAVANEMARVSQQILQSNEEIKSQCVQMPQQVAATILNKFTVKGAVPVTKDDFDQYFNKLVAEMKSFQANSLMAKVVSGTVSESSSVYAMFTWGGKLHMVPANWTLPNNCVKDVWTLWFFGHKEDKIRPYRLLEPRDMQNQNQKSMLSKIRRVMAEIIKTGVAMHLVEAESDVFTMNRDKSSTFFDKAFTVLYEKVKGSTVSNRWTEITVPTVYNMLEKYKKRNINELLLHH